MRLVGVNSLCYCNDRWQGLDMTVERIGRAPIGTAVLFTIIVIMVALSRAPLFGVEWLCVAGTRLIAIAWEVSPALCMALVALAGGTVGHRLAMKEVADQLVRERWSRRSRSMPLVEQPEFHLKPVRIALSSPARP